MDNREKFLEELKCQYEKEFEIKNSLETKANYNLASSGIVVGLLFTFGVALLQTFREISNINYIIALLLFSIGFFVTSVFFSVLALRIKDYYFAFLHDYFYTEENTLNEQTINEYKNMDSEKFFDKRIELYLRANKYNYTENENKATRIEIAHWLFLGGIGLILITILIFSLSAILK